MKKLVITNIVIFLFFLLALGQMGIGTLSPDPRSILDLRTTPGKGRGLLIPRMSTDTRRGMLIGNDSLGMSLTYQQNGLMVYDNTENLFYGYIPSTMSVSGPTAIGKSFGPWRNSEDDYRKWQILNPWQSQYAFDGTSSQINLIQSSTANGYVGIGWTDPSQSPTSPLHVKGDAYLDDGSLKVDNNITSRSLYADTIGIAEQSVMNGFGTVPIGSIIMYHGNVSDLDNINKLGREGWVLCDGRDVSSQPGLSNPIITGNTPDLSGRFIAAMDGHNPEYTLGETGPDYFTFEGQNSSQFYELIDDGNKVKMKLKGMPRHNHNVTINSAGEHSHRYYDKYDNATLRREKNNDHTSVRDDSMIDEARTTDKAGVHSHSGTIDEEGGYLDQGRNQQYDGAPQENRPAFYVLAFIMRVK